MDKKVTQYPAGGVIKKKPVYDPDQELKDNFNKTLVYDNDRSVKDVVLSAAKRGNINPSFLLSSAWQEGFNKAVISPDDVSESYAAAVKKDKSLEEFPVDGFFNYGLDTFGDNYSKLKKYLPEGFDKSFKTYQTTNEKNEKITTAAFRNNEDALVAKAAYLNSMRDDVIGYAKQKGLNTLDERTSDYFTLASYNGGLGNAKKIIDQYQTSTDQTNFIDKGLTQQQGVHKNIIPRLNREKLSNDLLGITPAKPAIMKKGGKIKYEDGARMEDPLFKKTPVPGINVWEDGVTSKVPVNPNTPQNEQIFRIDEKGTVQQTPSNIIPLEQFYNQSSDMYGNTQNTGTGRYVNDQGEVNTLDQQQTENDKISAQNKATSDSNYKLKDQVEMAAGVGMTAINSFFNKKNQGQQDRTNLRKAIMEEQFSPVFSPYAEGTGSQAIMKNGGEISGSNQGVEILGGGKTKLISSSDHSNPMIEFTGREHTEGGIGMSYGGKIAEVENKEIGFVDDKGGLNIFGKLKLPGTNQTFRKTAKDLAEKESKVDGEKSKYINILQNTNNANPYTETALSTAKIMFKSLDKQSKEIAEKKEGLASFQNLILSMTETSRESVKKYEYGGRMENGGTVEGDELDKLMQALGKYESGNKYNIKGVTVTKGSYKGQKALGKYQVMQGNVKDWSKDAIGREISEEEFLSNPGLQDQIVKHRLSVIAGKYKNPEDIASVWFSGRPAKNNNAKDDNNTSVNSYVNSVMSIYNNDNVNFSTNSAKDPPTKQQIEELRKKASMEALDGVHGVYSKQFEYYQKTGSFMNSNKTKTIPGKTQVKVSGGTQAGNSGDDYVPNYTPISQMDRVIDTPYGAAYRNPASFSDKVNLGQGDRNRGYISPLALEQIAPELLTMATNRKDPVNQLSYQPDLKQTFDISYQLGRNENQSSFNQAAKIAESTGNVDALSQLAAQKYKADETYNMQEIQGNATQKLGVYNSNVDTLNDARLKNLALIADQQTKQAQAKFNTRKEDITAFTSIAGKELQNQLENKTYNAYANLFKHYGFDKKGNVTFSPDDVATKFNEGEAQQFGMMAAQQGANAIMNGNFSRQFTKVKNEDGSTTTTETYGTNKKIQDKYKTLKNQGFDENLIRNMLRAEFPETISQ